LMSMAVASRPGRQLALCDRVRLSTRTVRPQARSHSHGVMQVTTRHTTSVTPGTWVLHCPYRKLLQQTRRRSQLPSAQRHEHRAPGERLQSMM